MNRFFLILGICILPYNALAYVGTFSGEEYENWYQDSRVVEINTRVNNQIADAEDDDLYGFEKWVVWPKSLYGDCDDHVITKLFELLEAGYSRSNIRMATAHTEYNDFHVVLLVKSEGQTGVLDNRRDIIVPIESLPYRWQAVEDSSGFWVSVNGSSRPDSFWNPETGIGHILPPLGYTAYCSDSSEWDPVCKSREIAITPTEIRVKREPTESIDLGEPLWKY